MSFATHSQMKLNEEIGICLIFSYGMSAVRDAHLRIHVICMYMYVFMYTGLCEPRTAITIPYGYGIFEWFSYIFVFELGRLLRLLLVSLDLLKHSPNRRSHTGNSENFSLQTGYDVAPPFRPRLLVDIGCLSERFHYGRLFFFILSQFYKIL